MNEDIRDKNEDTSSYVIIGIDHHIEKIEDQEPEEVKE